MGKDYKLKYCKTSYQSNKLFENIEIIRLHLKLTPCGRKKALSNVLFASST